MTAFANHAFIELRGSLRNRQMLFLTYAFPLAFYALMGLIMTGINPMFTEIMIPAMMIFVIMFATLMGLPDYLVNAREAGIFRSYKIFGVPAGNILAAPALTANLHIAVVVNVIAWTAGPLFGAPGPTDAVAFILVTAVTSLVFTGLSMLIGVVSSISRATMLWSQLIFLPSMLVGGLMIPYDMLPDAAQSLARLFPATYAMNAYRGLAYGLPADFSPAWSLILLTTSGALAFGLASYLFNWDRHNESRRGHPGLALLALTPYVAGVLLLG